MKEVPAVRTSDYPISPLILHRWSSRAMSGEPLSEGEIHSLFEAARWAPSSYNAQPWRFLYAKQGSPHWKTFFDLLVDFNKSWCKQAALLGLCLSRKTYERNNKPSPTHAYDAGAAWENLSLEGSSRGLVVHGMEGFDFQRARTALHVPEEYEVLAMFAVGKKAPKETLPAELQDKEVFSTRKKIGEFAFEGPFPRP